MINSTCSTCILKKDLSAYWVAEMYHRFDNGSYLNVRMENLLVYYLHRGEESDGPVRAFPEGFKMVAGNPGKRTYVSSSNADKAVSFLCLHGPDAPYEPQGPFLPQKNCEWGLRAQINMPYCWDGKNVYLEGVPSPHVSYPAGKFADNGPCPSTHPVRLPHLFYEVMFDTNSIFGPGKPLEGHTPNLTLAMGDTTGRGWHADFLNGWDVDYLQTAIDQCGKNNTDGVIEHCPAFADGFFTSDERKQCAKNFAPLTTEKVLGIVERVPGMILLEETTVLNNKNSTQNDRTNSANDTGSQAGISQSTSSSGSNIRGALDFNIACLVAILVLYL